MSEVEALSKMSYIVHFCMYFYIISILYYIFIIYIYIYIANASLNKLY